MEFLNYIGTWSVLKWVMLVLIAGFIGQFGRMMAEAMIARVRLRRDKMRPMPEEAAPQEKSSVAPGNVPIAELSGKSAPAEVMPDKKSLKIMAKARKKEAKNH